MKMLNLILWCKSVVVWDSDEAVAREIQIKIELCQS